MARLSPDAWDWVALRGLVTGLGSYRTECHPQHRAAAAAAAREHGLAVKSAGPEEVCLVLWESPRSGGSGPQMPGERRR